MGNFSRDTFNRLKHYVSVRMQQGVPVVDADWNELQDIRKHELEAFLKWFVGDGVPLGNNGFAIGTVAADNDFSIADGHCLVEGWDAVNDRAERHEGQALRYSSQPLFGNAALAAKWGVDPLPPLTASTTQRTDMVYLDVWEREVDSEEDQDILNPDIGIETCVRTKREWLVRVAEGIATEEELSALPPPEGHVFYRLATLDRTAGQNLIGDITDLRHTSLTLAGKVDRSGDRIAGDLTVDGHVGVGTTSPSQRLEIGGGNVVIDRLRASDESMYVGTGGSDGVINPGTSGGAQIEFQNIREGADSSQAIHLLTHHTGVSHQRRMTIDKDGNVGIGTTNPGTKLTINNMIDSSSIPDLGFGQANVHALSVQSEYGGLDSEALAMFRHTDGDSFSDVVLQHKYMGESPGRAISVWTGKSGSGRETHYVGHGGEGYFAGNVGIGTRNSPDRLSVKGNVVIAPGNNSGADSSGIAYLRIWDERGFSGSPNVGEHIRLDTYIGESGEDSYFLRATRLIWGGSQGKEDAFYVKGSGDTHIRGNVGIGTQNPSSKLQISSGDGNALLLRKDGLGGLSSITFHSQGLHSGVQQEYAKVSGGYGGYWSGAGILTFSTRADIAQPLEEKMRLDNLGRVGIGTESPQHALHVEGTTWAHANLLRGGDYAEYLESVNGEEIPVATSIILEKGRIRPAKKGETPIGVISSNPGVVGGVHTEWPMKYRRNEFFELVMEKYEEEVMAPKKEKVTRERQKVEKRTVEQQATHTEVVLEAGKYLQKEITETVTREVEEPVFEEVDLYDATGKSVIGKHRVPVMETYEEEIDVLDDDGQPVLEGTGKFEAKNRPKLNPQYDKSKEYVPREKRPEWNCVGLLGKLPLRKGQPVSGSWIKMKDLSDEIELWLVK